LSRPSIDTNKAVTMSLEEELKKLTAGANNVADGCKDTDKTIGRIRRKSKDLAEELDAIYETVSSMAEAASVWRTLGGFKRVRRNSKDLGEDTLRASFAEIDADGSGKISKEELRGAIEGESGKLSEDQITALLNFADVDGDGEIDFDEYKEIMAFQSGVAGAGAPAAARHTGS